MKSCSFLIVLFLSSEFSNSDFKSSHRLHVSIGTEYQECDGDGNLRSDLADH